MISGLEDILKGSPSPELIAGDHTAAAAALPLAPAQEMREDDKKPKETGKLLPTKSKLPKA